MRHRREIHFRRDFEPCHGRETFFILEGLFHFVITQVDLSRGQFECRILRSPPGFYDNYLGHFSPIMGLLWTDNIL